MASAVTDMARQKRNDLAVKIEADIIIKARTIASYHDITLAAYLSDFLRPIIDREFEKFKKELHSATKTKPQ